jgi:hypothetical protein
MRAAIASQAGSPDSAMRTGLACWSLAWPSSWMGSAPLTAPGPAAATAPRGSSASSAHEVLAQAADPAHSLVDAVAEAIQQVASLHAGCDLRHPGTPSATMVLRAHDEGADYLALADATLLLDTVEGL